MSVMGLQTLLASSIVNRTHRVELLRRNPSAYEGFDLSPEEVGVLMNIRATTLEEFALQAHRLFYNEDLLLESNPTIYMRPQLLPAVGWV